jgi:hypothetical protein
MVEKEFESRSPEQSVQDILEPGQRAQLAQHDRAPGPHSVNIVGEPLKAFSKFVTLKRSDSYRSQAQSLVFTQQQELVPPSLSEREWAMGFMEGMSQSLTPPLDEASSLRLLGGSMDLFQLTFLLGSILAFQKGLLEFSRLRDRHPRGLGGSVVPMHLPGISRHELTRLAQFGQLKGLLNGIAGTQAFVQSEHPPGGGVGMPLRPVSADTVATAQVGKVENLPTIVKVDGLQGKAVTKEFKWPINENSRPEEITALEEILDESRDVFAFDASELNIIEGETYHIKLTDETPIFKQQYRLSQAEKEILQEQMEERKAVGFIRPSTSEWAAPVTMPAKKDENGNWTLKRPCVDY